MKAFLAVLHSHQAVLGLKENQHYPENLKWRKHLSLVDDTVHSRRALQDFYRISSKLVWVFYRWINCLMTQYGMHIDLLFIVEWRERVITCDEL